MRKKFLEKLACPTCHGGLSVKSNGNVPNINLDLRRGELQCPQCRTTYQVVNGVPRFVDSQKYVSSFGKEWTTFDQTQLDSANRTRISYHRFHQLSPLELIQLRGKRVLEVGCGMGRFLEVVSQQGAETFGIDLSHAVESAADNLARYDNVCVAQADLFHLPFPRESFDYIYTFGVIHHTPAPKDAVREMAEFLKPGGKLTVWVYGKRGPSWIPRPYQVYGRALRLLEYDTLLNLLKGYVKFALAAGRMPGVGKLFRLAFPVQDLTLKGPGQDGYEDGSSRSLSTEFVNEWAWLNSFDMFTPKYTSQQTFPEVVEWFFDAGLQDIQRSEVRVSVTGTKPR